MERRAAVLLPDRGEPLLAADRVPVDAREPEPLADELVERLLVSSRRQTVPGREGRAPAFLPDRREDTGTLVDQATKDGRRVYQRRNSHPEIEPPFRIHPGAAAVRVDPHQPAAGPVQNARSRVAGQRVLVVVANPVAAEGCDDARFDLLRRGCGVADDADGISLSRVDRRDKSEAECACRVAADLDDLVVQTAEPVLEYAENRKSLLRPWITCGIRLEVERDLSLRRRIGVEAMPCAYEQICSDERPGAGPSVATHGLADGSLVSIDELHRYPQRAVIRLDVLRIVDPAALALERAEVDQLGALERALRETEVRRVELLGREDDLRHGLPPSQGSLVAYNGDASPFRARGCTLPCTRDAVARV